MLNQGVISEINGCISTGKEANVYHARMPDGTEGAIKVTSAACSLQQHLADNSAGAGLQNVDSYLQGPGALRDRRIPLQAWVTTLHSSRIVC